MSTLPLLCVHASAFSKDVVFRFADARFAVEGGALVVRSASLPHADLMAFAPGVWKASWHEDENGDPLGLLPTEPSTSQQVLTEPPAVGSSSAPSSSLRVEREQLILEALHAQHYQGLASFSQSLGLPASEVERILVSLLQRKGVDPDQIALSSVQSVLDLQLPTFLLTRHPQGVRDIMQHLHQNPDTRVCDYVQLHIWLKRNPIKRPVM